MVDPKIRIRASDESGPAFRQAEGNLKKLEGAYSKFGTQIASALGTGGLVLFVKSAIDANDELLKLAQRTGVAFETLGGLGFAAEKAGGSMDSIADAADKLNKSLAEAASGQKLAKEAFDALGISATDAAGQTKSVDVAMAEIADKFASFADGPEKAALAMRLFGKAGADQIVLLNAGGDALRQQIEYYKQFSGVSEETAKRSEIFNDTISDIGLATTRLGNSLASNLLPSLQAVADELLNLQEKSNGFEGFGQVARLVFDKLSLAAAALTTQLVVVGKTWGALAAIVTNPGSAKTIFSFLKDDIRAAYSELGRFADRLNGIGVSSPNDESAAERRRLGLSGPATAKRAAPRLPSTITGSKGGAPKADPITDAERALARYVDQLSKTIEKTQDLSEQEKALNFLREIGTTGQIPQVRELVLGLAAQIDAEKALTAATEERIRLGRESSIAAGERIAEENRIYQERLKSLTDSAASNVFQRQQEDLTFLQQALERGAISLQIYTESVQNLFNISGEGFDKLTSFAEQAAKNIQDSIGAGLSDILNGNFSDIGKNFTQLINRMVAEAAAAKITENLFGKGGGGGGVFGDVLGSFGKLLGLGGARAGGGSVSSGSTYLVGERGPELFTPQQSGQIIPNHALAGGAGRSMSITINPPAGMGRHAQNQFAADVARQLRMADAYNN